MQTDVLDVLLRTRTNGNYHVADARGIARITGEGKKVIRMSDLIDRKLAKDAIHKKLDGASFDGDLWHVADDIDDILDELPSVQSDQLDETRLSQGIWAKVCKITDSEGLQHEVIHYGDLKAVIEEVTGWII